LFHQTRLFLWSYALHTAPTFLCKESRQRYTKNLLVFGFPAEGGVPPSIPPMIYLTFVIDKGERDRLRLLRGQSPQGMSKGNPLRYAFGSFSRKRKGTAGVGCVTPQAKSVPCPHFLLRKFSVITQYQLTRKCSILSIEHSPILIFKQMCESACTQSTQSVQSSSPQ